MSQRRSIVQPRTFLAAELNAGYALSPAEIRDFALENGFAPSMGNRLAEEVTTGIFGQIAKVPLLCLETDAGNAFYVSIFAWGNPQLFARVQEERQRIHDGRPRVPREGGTLLEFRTFKRKEA